MRTNLTRSLKLLYAAAVAAVSICAHADSPAPVVTGMPGASGLAFNKVKRKLYVSTNSGVAIIDATTFSVDSIIPTAGAGEVAADWRRDRIAYTDPNGGFTVADGESGSTLGAVTLPHAATGVTLDPRLGRFLAADAVENSVYQLDSNGGSSLGSFPVGGGNSFTRLGSDGTNGTAYSVYRDATGDEIDATNLASYAVSNIPSVGTQPSCVAVNPNTHRLYVGLQSQNAIAVYDTQTNSFVTLIGVPAEIEEIDLDRRGDLIYAIGNGRTEIYRIDAESGGVEDTGTASSPGGFQRLAVDGVSGEVYVTDGESLLKWAAPVPLGGYAYRSVWAAEYPGSVDLNHSNLNDNGQLTVWAFLGSIGGVNTFRGLVNDVDGVMYEPYPGRNADLYWINDSQQIAGGIRTGAFRHAFVGDLNGNYTDFQPWGYDQFSRGMAINEQGQLVGEARVTDGSTHAFFHDPVLGTTDLGSFGGSRTLAQDINENDYIAGAGMVPGDQWRAAMATGVATLVSIGTLGGDYSFTIALNQLNQAVGESHIADGTMHGFLWDETDGMQDLGAIDTWSSMNVINNLDVAVGNGDQGPIIFDFVNGMRYLEPFVQQPVGSQPQYVGFITDEGYIASNRIKDADGSKMAYIYVPVPSPTVQALSISPDEVVGGDSAVGKIVLAAPAGPGGIDISLSSDTAQVTVTSSVHVDEGQYTGTFDVNTAAVPETTSAVISAVSGTVTTGTTLIVDAPAVASVTFAQPSVVGGTHNTATITLADPAPAGGATVLLSSDTPPAMAPVLTQITINEGDTSGTADINTAPVSADTTVTLYARYQGLTTGSFVVKAPRPISLTSDNQSAPGGTMVTFNVHLDGPAPDNYAVAMTSTNANAPAPASVSFATGTTDAGQALITLPVDADQTATIKVSYAGGTASEVLTIQAAQIRANNLNPAIVFGGQSTSGTVTLTGPAGPSGATITMSKVGSGATISPTSLVIPAGGISKTYSVTTTSVNATSTVTINAKWKTITKPATLTIKPIQMLSVSYLNSVGTTITSIKGGSIIKMRVALSGPAPSAGAVVSLSTSNSKVMPLPKNVTVPGGQTSVIVSNIKLGTVKTTTLVTGTGTYNSSSKSANLTVTP